MREKSLCMEDFTIFELMEVNGKIELQFLML